MNSEEIEQFIALIARENKVVIGANDPIAMQLTAMRFVLLELAEAQRGIVQEFRESVATSTADWENRSQKRAEAIMNAAVLAAKNAVAAGAQAGVAAGLPAFVEATERVTRQMNVQAQQTRRLLLWVAGAAVCVLLGELALLGFWLWLPGMHR